MDFDPFNYIIPDINAIRHSEIVDTITPVGQLIEDQIKIQQEQLKELKNNYEKLKELYSLKAEEANKYEKEAKVSKKYNIVMLIVTLISTWVAIASLVATILIAIFN